MTIEPWPAEVVQQLAAALGWTREQVVEHLDEARAAGLIRADTDGIAAVLPEVDR